MDKPEQFKYQVGKIADTIFNNWNLSADNLFSLWLDDLLTNFGFNKGKHYRAITEKERSVLFNLGQLYAQAVIDHPYCDVLGRVYEEVASRGQKKSLSQYFSPMTIADAMSKMTLNDAVQQIKNSDKEIFSVGEPACGSGVMMLSILKELKANNHELINKVELTMIDLDINCVKMASIQILSNLLIHDDNIAGLHIYRGNSLGAPSDLEPFVSFRSYKPKEGTQKEMMNDVFMQWAEGF